MPVSLENSKLIYRALKACGIRLLSALPETWLVHLIQIAEDDPEMTLVRLAKEEEGVGLSAGAHFAGVKSAMLMQNHGFLAAINGIVSFAHLYKIPLLMLISYRGGFGERDPWQTQGGNVTEPLLRAMNIPFLSLDASASVEKRVAQAHTLAESSLQPVALLLTRDLMWEESCCASIAFAPFTPTLNNASSSPSWALCRPSFNPLAIAPIFSICNTPWALLLPRASALLSVCPIRKS